ncbi:VOC family protein [Fusibacter ferrireducens]|uniref:VOC family protein n=1 Tax=Fusibacter ferrireducens TaxID=2785058 RepID=A0ABR9ZSU1_9FIRM|nr:VOC family protein [Fusibacter ferrireducens]MBF4693518.1 VOC family protein [Fusibacter ferrireducens]
MAIIAYLNFQGKSKDASTYYAEIFGSEKPKFMFFGDMPPDPNFPMTGEVKSLVMHTEIKFDNNTIMFSDVPPGMPFTMGNNISLLISIKDPERIRAYFSKLSVDGQVQMPLQETFWSKLYGNLVDKFGISWQFNLDSE